MKATPGRSPLSGLKPLFPPEPHDVIPLGDRVALLQLNRGKRAAVRTARTRGLGAPYTVHGLTADEETALADWSPTSDVIETKDEIVIKAELPGIDEKNVDVEIEAGVLTIKGERNAEKETEEKGYRRMERSYSSFLRSFTLPTNVEPEKISASFANGLLEVHLPKKEGAKPRSIKVEVKKQLATAA